MEMFECIDENAKKNQVFRQASLPRVSNLETVMIWNFK